MPTICALFQRLPPLSNMLKSLPHAFGRAHPTVSNTPITPTQAIPSTAVSQRSGITIVDHYKQGRPILFTTMPVSIDTFVLDKFIKIVKTRKQAFTCNRLLRNRNVNRRVNLSGSIIFNKSRDLIYDSSPINSLGGFGFIINPDQVEIQHAFPCSPITYNLRHRTIITDKPKRRDENPSKYQLCARSYSPPEYRVTSMQTFRDKKFKVINHALHPRSNLEILQTLSKFVEKGRERYQTIGTERNFTEILFLPKNRPQDMISAVFINLSRNSSDKLDETAVNQKLSQNQKTILTLSEKTNGVPILAFYRKPGSEYCTLGLIKKDENGSFVLSTTPIKPTTGLEQLQGRLRQ